VRGGVPGLVVADGRPRPGFRPHPAPAAEPGRRPLVPHPAHLLHRRTRTFFRSPAARTDTNPVTTRAGVRCRIRARSSRPSKWVNPTSCSATRNGSSTTARRKATRRTVRTDRRRPVVAKYLTSPVAAFTATTRRCRCRAANTSHARYFHTPTPPVSCRTTARPHPFRAVGFRSPRASTRRPPSRVATRYDTGTSPTYARPPRSSTHRNAGTAPYPSSDVSQSKATPSRRDRTHCHTATFHLASCRSSSGIPAARHRSRPAAHDCGRYRSASGRTSRSPRHAPRWTVTTPSSTFPTHPRYCRCTPGVWSPFSTTLVSSIRPTVPSRAGSGSAARAAPDFRRRVTPIPASSRAAASRNTRRVRTVVPARRANGSTVFRGSSDRSPRQYASTCRAVGAEPTCRRNPRRYAANPGPTPAKSASVIGFPPVGGQTTTDQGCAVVLGG